MTHYLGPAMALALVLVVTIACGGGGSSSVFEELLSHIPDTPDTRARVEMSDFVRARDLFEVPLPGADAGREALEEYVSQLQPPSSGGYVLFDPLGDGNYLSGYGRFVPAALDSAEYVGFDLRNVDQSISAGVPPVRLHVLLGRFDPEASDAGMRGGDLENRDLASECPRMDTRTHSGVEYYYWDVAAPHHANLRCKFAPPTFDRMGRAAPMDVQEEHVLRAYTYDGMENLIDTGLGERASLADSKVFRLLARGMAELGAYSVFMSDETLDMDDELDYFRGAGASGKQQERFVKGDRPTALRPFRAFATGASRDGQGEYMALALVHDNEADAEDNVDLLRRRLNEGSSFRSRTP